MNFIFFPLPQKPSLLYRPLALSLAMAFGMSTTAPSFAQQQAPTPPPPEVPPLSEMLGADPLDIPDDPTAIPDIPDIPSFDDPAPSLPTPPDVNPVPSLDEPGALDPLDPNVGPSPIDPPIIPAVPTMPGGPAPSDPVLPVVPTATLPATVDTGGGAMPREFQGDDVGTVLRLLARQARVNLVVSEEVVGTVTMRLENVTAFEAIRIICTAKNLFLTEVDNVFYVKTAAEKEAEPQEPGSFRFSYATARTVAPLLQSELISKAAPTVDDRTNTIFFREVQSNMSTILAFLQQVDSPTRQVMIEARLVEVTANPSQKYGINWSGALLNQRLDLIGSGAGSTSSVTRESNTTFGSTSANNAGTRTFPPTTLSDGSVITGRTIVGPNSSTVSNSNTLSTSTAVAGFAKNTDEQGRFVVDPAGGILQDGGFALDPSNLFNTFGGQFAILNVPQMSATLSLLNQDSDAEFLANPRIVTADNQEATIKITRNQPVPQLNFNEQTATAVFGGFEDKEFGNTLVVRPTINKEDFITLSIRPEISNKVGDAEFAFAGAIVASPIIDTRSLESNVLIKSGDTLAVGGLLQDEIRKGRTKVPILGDIPLLGYLFTEVSNDRQKRDLLIFVTPSIISERYGTGLERQITTGLNNVSEEFADPNGWLNNARGSVRLVPTSQQQLTTRYPQYPVPGSPGTGGNLRPPTMPTKSSPARGR